MFPDVLVATALFLALVVSSVAVAQTVADFVVDRVSQSAQVLQSWNRSHLALDCCGPTGGFGPCSC